VSRRNTHARVDRSTDAMVRTRVSFAMGGTDRADTTSQAIRGVRRTMQRRKDDASSAGERELEETVELSPARD
jgi:hypothetical protein